ncbi:MAG: glycosyltransferase family 2 protein [Eubacteriales bacterium]|nr:glycosyltransferase family 2 protein [Eubacteriales bacterium]
MSDIAFPVVELPKVVEANTDNYLISICVPTYNRCDDLKVCLESIFVKYGNSKDVEIVVIDNGSSDQTSEYLRENNIFSNTRFFIRQFNAGFDINVLDCFYKAKGKYVHFLGDDDVLIFEAFDELLQTIKKYEPDLIVSDYAVKIDNNTFIKIKKKQKQFTGIEDLFSYVGHHITFMSSITLKKKPVVFQSICRHINFKYMHISLMLEILAGKKYKLVFLDKPIALATDKNPHTYDVAEYVLIDLIRPFRLNTCKLNIRTLEPFFISVMCYCLGSHISIFKFLFSNAIFDLVRLKSLLHFKTLKMFTRTFIIRLIVSYNLNSTLIKKLSDLWHKNS